MNYPPNWDRPPYFGGPPYYFNSGPQRPDAPSLEDLLAARKQLDALEDELKKKHKDKEEKDKNKSFKFPSLSLGAVFGILSIGSFPYVIMQLAFLDWVRTSITVFMKATP